jgi:ankyrin repeat protein/energy-coupling factor transporter ATP-binding protein EcfA2
MHTDSSSPRSPSHPLFPLFNPSAPSTDTRENHLDDFHRCVKALEAKNDAYVYSLLKTTPALQDVHDSHGRRLIHHMVLNEQVNFQQLVTLRLDINAQDYHGWTPLHYAIQLKKGDTSQGSVAIVKSLIDLQADVNKQEIKGQTPLHFAVHQGNVGMVKLLCEQPAIDIQRRDNNGWTALHWAVTPVQHRRLYLSENKIAIIQLLCKTYQADPNAQDKQGQTPLHLAVSLFNQLGTQDNVKIFFTQIIHTLLELGASEMVLDHQNQTVLDIDEKGLLKNLSPIHPIKQLTFTGNFITAHSPSLENTRPWQDIPQFAVITGPNGSGKSHLLNYVAAFLKKLGPDIFYVYKDAHSLEAYHPVKNTDYNLTHPQLSPEQQTQLIEQVRTILAGGPTHPLSDERALLTAQRIQQANLDLTAISDKVILKYVYQIPVIKEKTLFSSHALSLLGNIFDIYVQRKKRIMAGYHQLAHSKILFTAYCTQRKRPEGEATYRDFLEILEDPAEVESLLNKIADDESGIPPWEELNALFQKNGLNLQIHYESHADKTNALTFTRTWQGRSVSIDSKQLSSGESLILDMFAWQYYTAGLSKDEHKNAITQKVAIMLLDEPDRHFDPKLGKLFMNCLQYMAEKHNIQIMMTTHRIDTLAFAPQRSIFTITRDEKNIASIQPTNPLNAMFKLTSNLRKVTNFHIKVYTESFDDATFYEKVYHQLLRLSEETRKVHTATLTLKPGKILSRRFQLSFYSVAMDKRGGGGGCQAIPMALQRETLALQNIDRAETDTLINRKIEYPFGLIDADFDLVTPNPTRINPSFAAIKSQLLYTKRHSLENYLYDPVLLFSTLNEDDINAWSTDDKLTKLALNCHRLINQPYDAALQIQVEEAFQAYFRYFIEAFITPEKPTSKKEYLQNYPYLPVGEIFEQISKPYLKAPEKLTCLSQGLSTALNREIAETEIVEALLEARAQEITLLSPEGRQGYTIRYPGLFIYARGHNLEEFAQTLFATEGTTFKEWLINKVITSQALSLPMDLVETIIELDRKVTNQANAIIKPEKAPLSVSPSFV